MAFYPGRAIRPAQFLGARGRGAAGAGQPVRAVVVAQQVRWLRAEWRRLAHLLGDPARPKRHDPEGVERVEEQVGDREDVDRPEVGSMIARGGRPGLPPAPWRPRPPAVLPLVDVATRLPGFSSSPRMDSAPQGRLLAAIPGST